jgi:hypothetical protein
MILFKYLTSIGIINTIVSAWFAAIAVKENTLLGTDYTFLGVFFSLFISIMVVAGVLSLAFLAFCQTKQPAHYQGKSLR